MHRLHVAPTAQKHDGSLVNVQMITQRGKGSSESVTSYSRQSGCIAGPVDPLVHGRWPLSYKSLVTWLRKNLKQSGYHHRYLTSRQSCFRRVLQNEIVSLIRDVCFIHADIAVPNPDWDCSYYNEQIAELEKENAMVREIEKLFWGKYVF